MNLDTIRQCAHSPQGTKLMLENMGRTQSLDPPAKFFPWVVMDGITLNSTESLLLGKTVCQRYVEKVRPYINGSVPQPLGCFFFPDEPPNFPDMQPNYPGIGILWVMGATIFVVGIAILAYWKYTTMRVAGREYQEINPWGDAARM